MAFEISPAVAGGLAAGILTPIIVGLLRKNNFLKYKNTLSFPDITTLGHKYEKWAMLTYVLYILFTIFLTYVWYKAFGYMTSYYYASHIKKSIFSIFYIKDFLFIPSFFLGMMTSYFPISLILKIILGKNYEEFCYYSDTKYSYGVKTKNFVILFLSSFIGILTAISPFFLDTYVLFTNDTIVIDQFKQFDNRKFSYQEIKQLNFYRSKVAPNGKTIKKPIYQILFKDGIAWSTIDNLRSPKIKYDEELFKFLAKRSKLDIKEYELMP